MSWFFWYKHLPASVAQSLTRCVRQTGDTPTFGAQLTTTFTLFVENEAHYVSVTSEVTAVSQH